METLASTWVHDPCDLSDPRLRWHESSTAWKSQCVVDSSPPAGQMWTEQLSPHLQRNKQLQDTLLQREEELARLQEENNKLREFLNSSFVRNLEEKAKKLTTDGRRKLKRNPMHVDEGSFQNHTHQHLASHQVSKRVCRNLTAEFCSESKTETSVSSEPNLDLWVLRTLGLKDRDTIDTSGNSSSSTECCSRGFICNVSSGYSLNSLSPSISTSTPSPAHGIHQSLTTQTDYAYGAATYHQSACGYPIVQNCTTSPGHDSDSTATGLPEAVIRSYNTPTAFQSPPIAEEVPFTQSPDRAEICSDQAQTPEVNLTEHPMYWCSSQVTTQFSPPGEQISFSPLSSSSPVTNQPWMPVQGCAPKSLLVESQPPATPQMPRSQADLAFTMSLSPSSSVKTHSFPQGQAFIRKDTEGRWNFTWVPRQGP